MTVIKSHRVITVSAEMPAVQTSVEAEAREIIQQAEQTAEEIVVKAHKEAQKILENILDEGKKSIVEEQAQLKIQAEKNSEKGYKNGFDEGYSKGMEQGKTDGYSQAQSDCQQLLSDAEAIRSDLYRSRERLSHNLETDIVEMVQKIFEKIVRKLTEEDNDLIFSLVQNGIAQLDLANKLTIITCKSDYELLMDKKDEILSYANFVDELDLKYDYNMQRGDCIIETSKGNIDVSLSKQLGELRFFLSEMLNREE